MSSTLTIEPSKRKKRNLPNDLKFALRKKFGGTISNQKMDCSDLSYISALIDMEIAGAFELKEYIEKYEEIILDEEF